MAAFGVVALGLTGCDTTPPTFTVKPHVGFAVGSQLDDSDFNNDDPEDDFTSPVYRHLRWEAVDDAPGCEVRYDIEEVYSGMPPDLILEDSTATDLVVWHSDYNGDFGGGSLTIDGWNVIARDCRGNERTTGFAADGSPWVGSLVWQETGENVRYPPEWNDPHPVDFTGSWSSLVGPWASGGQVRHTSEAGASVSFPHEFDEGEHIALVMAKGPGRGSADIYVDDVKVATVDTYAPANDNRRIVFDQQLSAGTHTLKVVNLATAGHPRIDVDAFLTG